MCLDTDVSAFVKAEQRCCCLLFGNLLAQVSSDLRILVHLACNHLSDLGSGEGGVGESSSCLAKTFTNGKSFNSKSFQAESGQGPETVIFIYCYLRPDA